MARLLDSVIYCKYSNVNLGVVHYDKHSLCTENCVRVVGKLWSFAHFGCFVVEAESECFFNPFTGLRFDFTVGPPPFSRVRLWVGCVCVFGFRSGWGCEIKELRACNGDLFTRETVRLNGYPLEPHIIGFRVCGNHINNATCYKRNTVKIIDII